MAWDPNSSSWEWDAEGVILPSHVNGIDLRKPAASDWPSNTELCPIKPDGSLTHTSGQLCSSGERSSATTSQGVHMDVTKHESMLTNRGVIPGMPSMHAPLVFDGAGDHGNVVSMGQGRVPIVTTCIGGGAFAGCIDHGNGSLESVVRKGLHDSQGNGEPTHPPLIKATRQHLGFPPDKQQLSFSQDKQQSNSGQDKPCVVKSNGRDHLVAPKHMSNKGVDSFCNGNSKIPAEEQDSGKAMGSAGNRKIAAEEQHSGKAMGSAGSGDSLTGLQLGKRTYSLDNMTPSVPKATPKLTKKARASAAAMQIPRCQVEGCKLDLTTSKDYHRRHKVCEPHSKARKVIVASQEQRFCQQCSRFHILTEFDEAKRSCRRRLAGHNKRRRKPQPDPLELQARLRSTLADWSFLHQSRYPRLPFWQDAGDYRSGGLWSRKMTHYNDPPAYDYSLQSFGTETYMKGPSSSVTHDKFPLLLLQSPKSMMPMDTCDSRAHHQYLPGLVGGPHMGNGLSLASSSLGAGVFTGLETPPIMEVARVSDSGRALSLLSLHSQCSQAPDMVPLDLSGLANSTIGNDQHVQEDVIASQHYLLQGRDQYSCHDFSTTLSMTSNVHLPSTVNVHEVASEKEFYECSFLDNLNRQNGYEESHPMVMNMHAHEATDQGKQTQDLMQIASFRMPNAASHRPVMVFQPESSSMGDSQFSHETSFLKF